VFGRKVDDDHERHAGFARYSLKKGDERLKRAGGPADADYSWPALRLARRLYFLFFLVVTAAALVFGPLIVAVGHEGFYKELTKSVHQTTKG